MNSVFVSILFLLAFSLSPVHADASDGDDDQSDGHLGRSWEIIVAVSLALLLFGAAATITIITIRKRRRKQEQPKQPGFGYASHPSPTCLPSMPYGITRPSSVYQPQDKHGRKGPPDQLNQSV